MPDPSLLRPDESEEARLAHCRSTVDEWCRSVNMYEMSERLKHSLACVVLARVRFERRDAMEKAANIAQQHGALYLSSSRKAACFAVAAAIRREMGE